VYQPHALDDGSSDAVVGPDYGVSFTGRYFNFRKASIYAGSNEIQRNIITRHILGL